MHDFSTTLSDLQGKGRFRELRKLTKLSNGFVEWEGKTYLNLSSNDYLGIAHNKQLHEEFFATIDRSDLLNDFGLSAASSRLLTGNGSAYTELEQKLAQLFGTESALVFNSGYHANIGILPALSSKDDLILSDKLNHASLIDGTRLCAAKHIRYKHLDYTHLESVLEKQRDSHKRVFIVSESIFSMDGDIADLQKLVELKKKYGCILYIDEAHAFGTRGNKGLGMCEETGTIDSIDIIVGTFGKAAASQGAYAACSEEIRNMLINCMRPFIFTTGLPPVNIKWTNFIVDKISRMHAERKHLATISEHVKNRLTEKGFGSESASNIMPIIYGQDTIAAEKAQNAQDAGFLVFAIRPPTVPEGTARLRLSLSASHTLHDLDAFFQSCF